METPDAPDVSRRGAIKLGAAAALVGSTGAVGWHLLQGGEDASTEQLTGKEARQLAETYAPTVYFDEFDRWYPTDPRLYESERDGKTVVDGFTALDGYTERADSGETPPDPAVFYNAVQYEDSPLVAVQFWLYSVFDQFTTNFHWHDWEVLHVFHDRDREEPVLYVASAHGRSVPNNEFLDPEPERQPRILTELGSHSSALSVNDQPEEFVRVSVGDVIADITNLTIGGLESAAEIPLAYGLPRDEFSPIPFAVPELNGEPIYEDDRLPAVGPDSLVDRSLTYDSYRELVDPPADLPERSTGLQFAHEGNSSAEADVTYELLAATKLEHIDSFTGPQLSFEFDVPDYGEDAISGHISTAGTPWNDPRYTNPAADISEPVHRTELADRYDAIAQPSGVSRIVGVVGQTVQDTDAPDREGVTTEETPIETVALVESEPRAVPTFGGVAVATDVPEGDHRITVNGAGFAPHSETVTVDSESDVTPAGVEGEVPLTARKEAVKVEVDTEGADASLSRLAIEDDFGGRLYDAPLEGPDAVYVNQKGAYTTEVVDEENERGAFRVNPSDEERRTIEQPETGAASLANYVADVSSETAVSVRETAGLEGDSDDGDDDNDDDRSTGQPEGSGVRGLTRALEAASDAAERAAEHAREGDNPGTQQRLEVAQDRLDDASQRLAEAREDLPETVGNAVERRLEQGNRRAEQARNAEKL